MSDPDYTKKPENGNSSDEGRGLKVWVYEFAYLYKGRADKLLLSVALAILCMVGIGIACLGAVFQGPADIILCRPG